MATTINKLLDGVSNADGNGKEAVEPNTLPLANALDEKGQIHHLLVAAQSSRPVDAAGNPWTALYVYHSGNLVSTCYTISC